MFHRVAYFLVWFVLCMAVLSPNGWSATSKSPNEESSTKKKNKNLTHGDSDKDIDEETIEIVASPIQAGASVERADRDEIESTGSTSVDEVMEKFAGVDVTSGRKGQRSIFIRGFSQRQVKVLWDTLPLELPYDGTVDLSIIPAELIQSVTLLKGAGSALFGPNGMGGAINIRTRSFQSLPMIGVSVQAGQFNSVLANVYHSSRYGPVDVLVLAGVKQRSSFGLSSGFSASRNEDGGARENSSMNMMHTLAKMRWHIASHHELRAGLVFLDGSKGVEPDAFADPGRVRYWKYDPWRSLSVSLGHSGKYEDGWRSDEVAYLGVYDNRLLSYDDAGYDTQQLQRSFTSDYSDWVMGLRLRANGLVLDNDMVSVLSRSWVGVEYDTHEHIQDRIRDDPLSRTWMSAAQYFQLLLGRRWSLGAGLQGDLELLPGLAGQDDTVDWTLLPMVFATAWPLSWLEIKASVARRARFPTLKERFSSDGVFRLANPDLGPESAWHFGLDFLLEPWPGVKASLGVFDSEVEDLIQNMPVTTGSGTAEQLVNLGLSRLAGLELGLTFRPWERLAVKASYVWLYSRRLDVPAPDDRLEYRPSHKLVMQIDAQVRSWMRLWTGIRLQGPSDFFNQDNMSWGQLGVFMVWDARVEFSLTERASAWLMFTNLLDSNYQTHYGYPEQGRAAWVGLRFSYARFFSTGADKKQAR